MWFITSSFLNIKIKICKSKVENWELKKFKILTILGCFPLNCDTESRNDLEKDSWVTLKTYEEFLGLKKTVEALTENYSKWNSNTFFSSFFQILYNFEIIICFQFFSTDLLFITIWIIFHLIFSNIFLFPFFLQTFSYFFFRCFRRLPSARPIPCSLQHDEPRWKRWY